MFESSECKASGVGVENEAKLEAVVPKLSKPYAPEVDDCHFVDWSCFSFTVLSFYGDFVSLERKPFSRENNRAFNATSICASSRK